MAGPQADIVLFARHRLRSRKWITEHALLASAARALAAKPQDQF